MLDSDEWIILVNGIMLGALLKNVYLFLGVLVIFFVYRRGKSKYPRGFFTHIPHMIGLKEFKYFPNIFIRDFRE